MWRRDRRRNRRQRATIDAIVAEARGRVRIARGAYAVFVYDEDTNATPPGTRRFTIDADGEIEASQFFAVSR